MTVNNKFYDALKFIALVLLPALGTLYFAVAGIWGLPKAEQVVGTITAVDLFLGVILGLQSNVYNKSGAGLDGALHVTDTPHKTQFQLAIDTAPEQLAKQDRVVLKVTNMAPAAPVTMDSAGNTDPRLVK